MTDTQNLTILTGSCLEQLKTLPDNSIQCCVTSPPYYGLRSYLKSDDPAKAAEIGAEQTPDDYIKTMVEVFREVKRVLREDGVLWLNLGDSYTSGGRKNRAADAKDSKGGRKSDSRPDTPNGLKPKDLLMIPARVAIALQADGWYLRQEIVWAKPNVMPESVRDRCTRSHEFIYMLTKSERYYYDNEAIKEPTTMKPQRRLKQRSSTKDEMQLSGVKRPDYQLSDTPQKSHEKRNKRSVWWVNTKPYKGAHFAVFPAALITPCVLAGSRLSDTVLDPFGGSGTTAKVALDNGRKAVIIELNSEYIPLIYQRCGLAAPQAAPATL